MVKREMSGKLSAQESNGAPLEAPSDGKIFHSYWCSSPQSLDAWKCCDVEAVFFGDLALISRAGALAKLGVPPVCQKPPSVLVAHTIAPLDAEPCKAISCSAHPPDVTGNVSRESTHCPQTSGCTNEPLGGVRCTIP